MARELSSGFLNPASAIIGKRDNSSVCPLLSPPRAGFFLLGVTAASFLLLLLSTSSSFFRDCTRTGPEKRDRQVKTVLPRQKTIRSYVSVAAAYINLLEGARRALARGLERSEADCAHASCRISLRDFSPHIWQSRFSIDIRSWIMHSRLRGAHSPEETLFFLNVILSASVCFAESRAAAAYIPARPDSYLLHDSRSLLGGLLIVKTALHRYNRNADLCRSRIP